MAEPLTNFGARIVSELNLDDGVERTRSFEIEASLGERKPIRFHVPAGQFLAMNWPVQNLGASAILYPGVNAKDHARAAIQFLSGDIPSKDVYTHLGWRETGYGRVYLHADGGIGSAGTIEDVEVSVDGSLSKMILPSPNAAEAADSIRASLRFLNLAPKPITVPLWASIWRSVLDDADFGLHLSGRTGVGKSALAALVQQHFGAGMDGRNLPGSWASTDNALEVVAFTAKDSLIVVDDFAPEGSRANIDRMQQRAARLFRAQGNNSGRQRLRPDATLRATKYRRGLIVSTGEEIPRGHSIRARLLILDLADDLDWDALTDMQRLADGGVFAQALACFVQWLAGREESPRLSRLSRKEQIFASTQNEFSHKRIPMIIADLGAGLKLFIEFAEEIRALTINEGGALWADCWAALCEVAHAQENHQRESDPVRQFVERLADAIGSGAAHVAGNDGKARVAPEVWGWRLKTIGAGMNERDEWQPMGTRIGWVDGDDLYLIPSSTYEVIQSVSGNSETIGVAEKTLWKRLREQNLLLTHESGRNLDKVTLEGTRRKVLHLSRYVVLETGTTGTQPPFGGETVPENCPGLWDTDGETGTPNRDIGPENPSKNDNSDVEVPVVPLSETYNGDSERVFSEEADDCPF